MATKQYIDINGLSRYKELSDAEIKDYVDEQTTHIVQETYSATTPSTAVTGDFWTELINDN